MLPAGWLTPLPQQDDAEENFTFRDGRFDFVHARNLAQSISGWPKLMSEVYR